MVILRLATFVTMSLSLSLSFTRAEHWSPFHDDAADATGLLDMSCDGIRKISARELDSAGTTADMFSQPFVTARKSWAADGIGRTRKSKYGSWSNRTWFLERFGDESIHHDLVAIFSFQGYTFKRSVLRDYVNEFMPNESDSVQISRLSVSQNGLQSDDMYDIEPLEINASYAFTSFRASDGEFANIMSDTTGQTGQDGLPKSLLNHMKQKASSQDLVLVDQVAMGPTGSGLGWHFHNDAWNSVVVGGYKLWLLAEPGFQHNLRSHNSITALQWWKRAQILESVKVGDDEEEDLVVPRAPDGVLTCVLGPGEIIWIPSQWPHATINLGHVVSRSQRLGKAGRKDATDRWNHNAVKEEMDTVCKDGIATPEDGLKDSSLLARQLKEIAKRAEIMLEPDFMRAACARESVWHAFKSTVQRCNDRVMRSASMQALKLERKINGRRHSPKTHHKIHLQALRNLMRALERFITCADPPFATPLSKMTTLELKRKKRVCPKPHEKPYGARCDRFDANLVRQMLHSKT